MAESMRLPRFRTKVSWCIWLRRNALRGRTNSLRLRGKYPYNARRAPGHQLDVTTDVSSELRLRDVLSRRGIAFDAFNLL
eukprot:1598723-Amphidinium_carterae.1